MTAMKQLLALLVAFGVVAAVAVYGMVVADNSDDLTGSSGHRTTLVIGGD